MLRAGPFVLVYRCVTEYLEKLFSILGFAYAAQYLKTEFGYLT